MKNTTKQKDRVSGQAAFTLAEVFSSHFAGHRKFAFTLAEVLITLGIFGIVAAMTMPALITHHREKSSINQLKKFLSVFNSAVKMSTIDNGDIESWVFPTSDNIKDENGNDTGVQSEDVVKNVDSFYKKYILPYLKYIKYDIESEKYAAYSLDGTPLHSGSDGGLTEQLVLSDGTVLNGLFLYGNPRNLGSSSGLEKTYGEVFVDLNGRKKPNTFGKDIFLFYLTKNGVVPMGTAEQKGGFNFESFCNPAATNRLNGYGCTGWAIYNENMDYLHCRSKLQWSGAKKCKQ